MTFAFTLAECRLLYDVVARGRADRAEGRDPGPLEDVVRSEHRRLHGVSGYDPSPDKLLAKLAALSPDEVRELQRACLRVLAWRRAAPNGHERAWRDGWVFPRVGLTGE